jgi:hypothetical protein
MTRHAWILVLLAACGEPVLRNAPKPNTAAVAGVAAATAAAVTLASPQDAAKQQEALSKPAPDDRGVKVKETVPDAVFDRLDQNAAQGSGQVNDAGVDGASAPAAPAAVGSGSRRTK